MKCAPTSDRIQEGIIKIVPVLDKIFKAKGGVVSNGHGCGENGWVKGGLT